MPSTHSPCRGIARKKSFFSVIWFFGAGYCVGLDNAYVWFRSRSDDRDGACDVHADVVCRVCSRRIPHNQTIIKIRTRGMGCLPRIENCREFFSRPHMRHHRKSINKCALPKLVRTCIQSRILFQMQKNCYSPDSGHTRF